MAIDCNERIERSNSTDNRWIRPTDIQRKNDCNRPTLNHWAVGRNIRPHLRLAIRLTVETNNSMYEIICISAKRICKIAFVNFRFKKVFSSMKNR